MSEWVELNGFLVGELVVLVPIVVVAGVLAWRSRGRGLGRGFGRGMRFSPTDFLLGYGMAFLFVIVAGVVLRPESAVGRGMYAVAPAVLGIAIAMAVRRLRVRRERGRELDEARAAREAIPAAATAYFFDGDFRSRAGFALASPAPPAPDLATELVSYWAFAALDSGEYVDFSRTIHYTTMVRGWTMSSPTLIEAVPVLVAPFVHSDDDPWDPVFHRAFRRTALALLATRFEERVPA